jgi:predicted permease
MTTLWNDIRYGLRMMQRNAGFTTIAIAMLALGIGANTAIFSVVDAALLRPLPFRAPDHLVQLWETESVEGQFPLTGADYLDWRAQNQSFEDMATYSYQQSFNASGAGEPERVSAVQTQANFFSILGLQPMLGRAFLQGEDQPGHNHVVILSYAFWQTHFGGQDDALNKSVELNGDPYTVVGIMPGWYRTPGAADLWIPIDATPKALGPRGQHHLRAIGRIKNGTTLAHAGADLRTIAGRIEKQFPNENTKVSAVVVPLKEQIVDGSGTQIWIMFGAVTLVLLIASVNVANLLLARATGRRREIAVRAAMGASRWSLIRQLLTESVLLSIFGAIPGVWLAYLCVDWLSSLQSIPVPQANPIGVNLNILLFTLGVSIFVGILFGLIPAIQSSQVKVYEELKSGGKMALTSNLGGRVVRNVLVVVEIALSLSLLTGAGLLIRTFSNLREVNIGVRSDKILTASVLLPSGTYATPDQQQSFFYHLVQELGAAPGVKGAAITSELPLQGGNNSFITIPGQSDESVQNQLVEITAITPDYFRVMGIPLVSGRGLTTADLENTASAYRKLLPLFMSGKFKPSDVDFVLNADISQAMAARYWPQQDPIGKQFGMD